tara:strand:- start:272 stop:1219 length:948 start_codon:yes stop_codon:yes gene_type:complete
MAEQNTFTVDTTPQTETVIDDSGSLENLTPDEQDSLAIGEEMTQQQDTLLAGKYENAEQLEKAYVELSKKLGEKSEPDSTETETPEAEAETKTEPEEKAETETEIEPDNSYLEDGSVNYTAVNEAYGEQLGNLFKSNEVDPWEISQYFHANDGKLNDSHYQKLEAAGLSRAAVDSYLQGRAVEMGYNSSTATNDITDATVNEIKSVAGGEQTYLDMVTWASNNLNKESIDAFDSIVNSGSVEAIKFAVNGLKSQYQEAMGNDGELLTGKAPTQTKDVFRSQAELVAAMNDRRYDNDPAYRQDVIAKLDRSNNLEF